MLNNNHKVLNHTKNQNVFFCCAYKDLPYPQIVTFNSSQLTTTMEVIHRFFCFGIKFLWNKHIGIFGHFMACSIATIHIFHLFQLPDIVDLELGVLSVMVNDAYLWIISYSQHCFFWNFVFYSRKAYSAHQYKNMLYNPWSYRITIDENPIPLKWICV